MPPKISEALSTEDQKALDRMIDADIDASEHLDETPEEDE